MEQGLGAETLSGKIDARHTAHHSTAQRKAGVRLLLTSNASLWSSAPLSTIAVTKLVHRRSSRIRMWGERREK